IEHDHDQPAGFDRRRVIVGWWYRHYEHHVGVRYRTDARDWHPHGNWRAQWRHPTSVLDRVDHAIARRRRDRSVLRHRDIDYYLADPGLAHADLAALSDDRSGLLGRRRRCLWLLPGAQSGRTGPD